jgi:hypothetical protein
MNRIISLSIYFLFICYAASFASDTLGVEDMPSNHGTASDSLRIPAYECYPLVRNYLFNQTVIDVQRWATIGAVVGGSVGAIFDAQEEFVFIPNSFIYGMIGTGIGSIAGITIGIYDGLKLRRMKKNNPDAHAYRCRLGYEFNCFELGLITSNKAITRMHDDPGLTIVYRPLRINALVPAKISLGINSDWWGRGSDYDVNSFGRLFFYKTEAAVQYNLYTTRLVVPYWSLGIGYAWGHETEDIQEMYFNEIFNRTESRPVGRNEYRIASPVLRGYAGCELNVFDFAYADLKIGYEAIGPYFAAHNKEYFPYGENVIIDFSLGTYIF